MTRAIAIVRKNSKRQQYNWPWCIWPLNKPDGQTMYTVEIRMLRWAGCASVFDCIQNKCIWVISELSSGNKIEMSWNSNVMRWPPGHITWKSNVYEFSAKSMRIIISFNFILFYSCCYSLLPFVWGQISLYGIARKFCSRLSGVLSTSTIQISHGLTENLYPVLLRYVIGWSFHDMIVTFQSTFQ